MATKLGIRRSAIFLIVIAVAIAGRATSQGVPRALDVGQLNSASYRSFINELRHGLADQYSQNVPVLPMYDEAHPQWFDLTLINGDQETTVRFRHDNIRVRGFRTQEPRQWYEFGRRQSDQHLIPGSEFLGFGDSYEELEHAAGRAVERVSLNMESLREAVSRLALPADHRQRAEALIIVSQVITEAARFPDIAEYLASNIDNRAPVLLEPWMRNDLERNWEHFSTMVLRCEANPSCNFQPPNIRGRQIETVDDLRNILGIIFRSPTTKILASRGRSHEIPRVLDVGELNSANYRTFINDLRHGLADEYSQNVPVLPKYDEAHPQLFDLKLINGDQEIILRFRRDNIRVRGFRMQEPQMWYEFGKRPSDQHLIPGSTFLTFGDSNEELEDAAGRAVEQVSLNAESLREAVSTLALHANRRQKAEALLVVSQMITEAVRFQDIAEYLASNLDNRVPVFLEPWMRNDLERNWEHFSTMVLRCEANPSCNFQPPNIRGRQIETVDDLRNILGIIFRSPTSVAGKASRADIPSVLNVRELNSASYRSFIHELRHGLAAQYSQNVPVLPTYDEAHPQWFDITLINGDQETTVRFRRDSIRVQGFRMQEPRQWYEFGRRQSDQHLIPGSEFLGFGNSYEEMEHVAGRAVERVSLNKESLIEVVSRLALSANRRQRAEALIVVSQMITEAARFPDISEYLASNLDNRAPLLLEPWMKNDLERNWEQYSTMVFRCEANPSCNFQPPNIRGRQIETVDDLRNILGIIFRSPTNHPTSSSKYLQMPKVFKFEARMIKREILKQLIRA